jgi:hypothetical protein
MYRYMHTIYYTTILDVMIQCELGREPGGQTSLPDNNLVLVSVNDINSFMTILIIIIFSFESNQINLDLLSNDAKIRDLLHSFSSNFLFLPCNCLLHHVEDYAMTFGLHILVELIKRQVCGIMI